MGSSKMMNAALVWAANGFAVFPCNPSPGRGSKAPLTPNGFLNASRDIATVAAWWTEHPNALVGMPTGRVNGIVVVDIDTHAGQVSGFDTLAKLEADGLILPPTRAEALTPSGGVHRYFACPEKGMRSKKLPGVDIQADRKYVIAPPSILADGRRWKFRGSIDDLLD